MTNMFSGGWTDNRYPMKLKRIKGIESFNTSKVKYFSDMFFETEYLMELDVSKWDTSSAISMSGMFVFMNAQVLDVSNFDTSNVTSMYRMFWWARRIKNLDLSNFDMSKVTNVTNMLSSLESIQKLKTPKAYPQSVTIGLPKTLKDASGNSYTSLDKNSPTGVWLTK